MIHTYKNHFIRQTYRFSNGKADYEIWAGSEHSQEGGWTEMETTLESVHQSIDDIFEELRSFTESKQTLI